MFDSVPLYEHDRSLQQRLCATLVGLDEAGRGPLAGPVVAAAVVLPLHAAIPGVTDSKKLSASQRDSLYSAITSAALAWSVGMASPEEIDRINILQASLTAMHRALQQISAPWTVALIDGNQRIPGLSPARQMTIVKGDALSASIAAASIVAKVTRDRLMDGYHEQFPAYGFDRHKGYATRFHRDRIRREGLSAIHRRSFCHAFAEQTELNLQGA